MKVMETCVQEYSLKKKKSKVQNIKIISSQSSERFARQLYGDDLEIYESVFLILLNNSNIIVGYVKIGQGGLTASFVDVRLVATYCLQSLANSCILVHNHPSGKLKTSNSDDNITKKIKDGLKLLDITLLDHIILTKDGYYSYADESSIL